MLRIVHIALIGFALAGTATSALSQESSVNRVVGIEARDLAGATEITIQGSARPTFSVYRLDRPARIFVDFSNSELVGDVTNWAVRNGLVDEVLVLQYRDEVSLVTRVVVALERDDAEYDIETTDTAVIMSVTAEGWSSPQRVAETQQRAQRDDQQVQQRERQRVDELEAQLAELRSLASSSTSQLDERSEELGELESEASRIAAREAQERERADRLSSELSDVQADLGSARSSEQEARHAMRQLAARSESLEQEIHSLTELVGERDLVAEELEATRSRRRALETELREILEQQETIEDAVVEAAQRRERFEQQSLEAQSELESARDQLERLRGERVVAEGEAAHTRAELEQTEAQLAVRRAEQTRVEAALNEQRLEAEALEAEVAAAELERQSVAADLAEAASERERIDADLVAAVERRDRLQTDLSQAAARRTELDADLAAATSELQIAEAQRERMDAELATAHAERERIGAELAEAQAERERLDVELAAATSERTRLQAELDGAARERQRLNQELALLAADHEQEEAALAVAAARRTEIEGELERMQGERSEAAAALGDVEARQTEVVGQLARLQGERDAINREIEGARADAQSALADMNGERERMATEIAVMEERLASLQRETEQRATADVAAEAEQSRSEQGELATERARRAALESELARQREALELAERTLTARDAELIARGREAELAREQAVRREAEATERARAERASQARLASHATSTEARAEPSRLAQSAPVEDARPSVSIVDVRFTQVHGVDRVEVEFDGPAPQVDSLPWRDGRAGLVIGTATLPERLHRTFDTRAYGGPVQFVSTYMDEAGDVRVVAELSQAASEILSRDANVAAWEFSSVESELAQAPASDAGSEFDGYNSQEDPTTAPPIRRPGGVSYTIGRQESRIRTPRLSRRFRVTIDVVNADIQNVLRLFSDQGDVNIIASGTVSGNITLRLRDVPLDVAFALILQSQGLGFEQQGNIIRVAPLEDFEEERQRQLARVAEAFDVEPLQVRLRPVSYADGDQLIALLADVLSSRGTASFDERTHTLILTDVPENLDAAEQLIDALDTQTPQVLIEARIVQTSQTFSQGFGIQWGGDALFSAANGNATGLLFPSTIGIAGGAGQTPNDGTAATPNYAVNLPGPQNGAIGFQFGSLGQAVNLNLRLMAAETSGDAKVVSAPRILTLDGQAATISTGVSIPVQTVGAAGTNVTFIQANLSLAVTPVVTPDGFVRLDLSVTKNEPDFARVGANGDPTIQTRSAQTNLLVRDGETSVIGGIFEHIQGEDQSAVPFFSDIPILGALFHNYSFQDERTETLIFITPRIVNRDVALTNYTPGGVLMTPPSGE